MMRAIKFLIGILVISQIAIASNNCSEEESKEANRLWRESIHIKDYNKKIAKLKEASKHCKLMRIVVDGKLAYYQTLSKKDLNNTQVKKELFKLRRINSNLKIDRNHKINNNIIINNLLGLKNEQLTGTMKALEDVGGLYSADIRFYKNSYRISNKEATEIKRLSQKIVQEVDKDPNALFAFIGGASSEGNADYNNWLSRKRADSLKRYIEQKYPNLRDNIVIYAKGESELVCVGGFLPVVNNNGEAKCITEEDKEASRRVTIRRER
jgi:outer membrane protein OmpA-like peptidoglycan-associated protein